MGAPEHMPKAQGSANPVITESITAVSSFAAALDDYLGRALKRALFSTLPLCDTAETAMQRLKEDRYLLRPCGGAFRPAETMETAADLLAILHEQLTDHGEEVARLETAISGGDLDLIHFLTLTYCNQGNELLGLMRRHGLDQSVATMFALYLTRPWRAQAAAMLREGLDLSIWKCGYCPVCGHWPSLGHISTESGQRTLWCLHCTTTWTFPRVRCAFCLNSDHEQLDILQPEGDDVHRVQACKTCRRYVKEFRSVSLPEQKVFEAVYLGTPMLDGAAQEEKYLRESNLTVRYDDPDGNELLMYRQRPLPVSCTAGGNGAGKDDTQSHAHTSTSEE
jgi:hypothetical protein